MSSPVSNQKLHNSNQISQFKDSSKYIGDLPDDILLKIFSLCKYSDTSAVDRYWNLKSSDKFVKLTLKEDNHINPNFAARFTNLRTIICKNPTLPQIVNIQKNLFKPAMEIKITDNWSIQHRDLKEQFIYQVEGEPRVTVLDGASELTTYFAIKRHPEWLGFARDEHRKNWNLVLAAAEHDITELKFADKELLKSEEFMKFLFRQEDRGNFERALVCAHRSLNYNYEFLLSAMKINPRIINSAPSKLPFNFDFADSIFTLYGIRLDKFPFNWPTTVQ